MSDRLDSLLKLLEQDPDDSFLWYGIALEHNSKGNYEEAKKYLTSLQKKDPDYVPAYMQLAHVY
jgi:tetratricopeptide (TPR) repeat protein